MCVPRDRGLKGVEPVMSGEWLSLLDRGLMGIELVMSGEWLSLRIDGG